jgi:hypothetical protein
MQNTVTVTWATCSRTFSGTDARERAWALRAHLLELWPDMIVTVQA